MRARERAPRRVKINGKRGTHLGTHPPGKRCVPPKCALKPELRREEQAAHREVRPPSDPIYVDHPEGRAIAF